MRVTHLGSHQAAVHRLTGSLSDFAATQDRLSTGKRLRRASDDPTGMARALELRASLRTRDHELRNADDGTMWVNLADTRLQSAVEHLQRARELAVRGATFTNADERNAIAREVESLRAGMVELANTRHQGRGLFAGFSTNDAVENVGGVWTYQGDAGQVNRRIGEAEVVSVNVTGDVAFGFTSGKDVFTVLDDFEAALVANDTSGIEAAIAELDTSMSTVLESLATLGATGSRIGSAHNRIMDDIGAIKSQLSNVEDVDLAEAVMDLQMQESAYQAALAAFARSSQSSLVDFLR
jgi:flagellar hook-associated protein 3 FlgL